MTATPLNLPLNERKTRKRLGPMLAARMIAILRKCGGDGWMTRRGFSFHWTDRHQLVRFNDRACRLGRECSHGRIIAGQKGYKLLRRATMEEYIASMGAWSKQIQAEQKQYSMTAKRWHGGKVE